MGEHWEQERPGFCPHQDCIFKRRVMDHMCVGDLPEPAPHDGDFNNHRLCLNGADSTGAVFDLQINDSDIWWFKFLFEALSSKDKP